jgi:hypothetical protein
VPKTSRDTKKDCGEPGSPNDTAGGRKRYLGRFCRDFSYSEVAMRCLRIYATPDGESHFG